MAELPLSLKIQVKPTDLTTYGQVSSPAYLHWCEEARQGLLTLLGSVAQTLVMRPVQVECRFAAPVSSPEELSVILSLQQVQARTVTLRYVFCSQQSSTQVAEVLEQLICSAADQARPLDWPDPVRSRLQELLFEQNWSEDTEG